MNPPDDLHRRLAELEARTRGIADGLALLPVLPELTEAMAIAAAKRGSRRWARTTWEPWP